MRRHGRRREGDAEAAAEGMAWCRPPPPGTRVHCIWPKASSPINEEEVQVNPALSSLSQSVARLPVAVSLSLVLPASARRSPALRRPRWRPEPRRGSSLLGSAPSMLRHSSRARVSAVSILRILRLRPLRIDRFVRFRRPLYHASLISVLSGGEH